MFKPPSLGELETEVTMEVSPAEAELDTPFRVLMLGDFSGRVSHAVAAPESPRVKIHPFELDRDNFDDVLASLGLKLNLSIEGAAEPVALDFGSLDDFHPDRIVERARVFSRLRDTRKKLLDQSTFAAAAAEVREWAGMGASPPPTEPPPRAADAPKRGGGSLLDRMLQATESRAQMAPEPRDEELQSFLREVVKPHLVPDTEPDLAALVACVDAATGKLMRAVLHHPDFQRIEAAWRALYFLVSRLETGPELKLYLCDISKPELESDLRSSGDLRTTAIYNLLVEETVETPGGEPWAVVVGNYSFEPTREDAETLGRIAKIAQLARAPFIAEASARALGCESVAATPDPRDWRRSDSEDREAWQAMRRLPEACYLGLALPRFLLRLPYGPATDPVEQFDFDEMRDGTGHQSYLWGNPAVACAYLLAEAFSRYGWRFVPGVRKEIDGLPLHVYSEGGESKMKPCAEVLLTERAAEATLAEGLMPWLSFKGRDTIRVARFQSLAEPLSRLAGRWLSPEAN